MYAVPVAISAWSSGIIGTLPEGFRPATGIGGVAFVEANANHVVPIDISPNCNIRIITRYVAISKGALFSYSITYPV